MKPSIVAVTKCIKLFVKILCTDSVILANDASLNDSPKGLDGVGMNHTTSIAFAVVDTYNGNASKTFAEFGGGAQYWINDNLSARILERYADISGNVINSAWTTSAGLNWQF